MFQNKINNATSSQSDRRLAIIFVFPAVFLVAVLMYYPMLRTFAQSLFETTLLKPEPHYVGFATYGTLFNDASFWTIVNNSLSWTLIVVALQAILGMASALLLNQNLPAKGLMRVIVLLPCVLPGVVI